MAVCAAMGDICAFGCDQNVYCEAGRVVVFVPLPDSTDNKKEKKAEDSDETDRKQNAEYGIKQIRSAKSIKCKRGNSFAAKRHIDASFLTKKQPLIPSFGTKGQASAVPPAFAPLGARSHSGNGGVCRPALTGRSRANQAVSQQGGFQPAATPLCSVFFRYFPVPRI